jgi:hypothetical protein
VRLRSSTPELSNNIIQKGLAFIGDWSGTVVKSGPHERPGILPRRLVGRGGASVVRRNAAINRMEDSMPKSAKKRSSKSTAARATAAKPPQPAITDREKKNDAGSKQARVIEMLQSPTGMTIAAMMKETGWQQHSVRGFLAGVVRKKLKLKLNSNKIDGSRVYRVDGADSAKPSGRQSRRRAA